MADVIQAGDFVQHKTGGPTMMVDSINMDGKDVQQASCSWISMATDIFRRETFPLTSLTKVA